MEGKTITQIAEERGLSNSTIEGHLAHYVDAGEIPIDKLVLPEIIELITGQIMGSEDIKMSPVKEALGEKVSWTDIRFVISHLNFLRKKSENEIN